MKESSSNLSNRVIELELKVAELEAQLAQLAALQASHDRLLEWTKCYRYHTENNKRDFESINADIAAADKLTGRKG